MGTASSKLVPASRSLLRKMELLENPLMRGNLPELALHRMKDMWGMQAMSISSRSNIVRENQEQMHLYRLARGIGQIVRHQHGRGDAGNSGDGSGDESGDGGGRRDGETGGGGKLNGSRGVDADYTGNIKGSGNSVATESEHGDKHIKDFKIYNDDTIRRKPLPKYIINIENELGHISTRIKFVRQRTHLLPTMFTHYTENVNLILGYLARVQFQVESIEVIIYLLQEESIPSIRMAQILIGEHLDSMQSDLAVIQEFIKSSQRLVIESEEQDLKRIHILFNLGETITLIHYLMLSIQRHNAHT